MWSTTGAVRDAKVMGCIKAVSSKLCGFQTPAALAFDDAAGASDDFKSFRCPNHFKWVGTFVGQVYRSMPCGEKT